MLYRRKCLPGAAKVSIKERCTDYAPAFDVVAVVQQLMDTVPEKYLKGLDCVVLTNETGLSRRDRVGRVWSRKRKFDKSRILGRYHPRTRTSQPYIELRVDKIMSRLKGVSRRVPFMRQLMIGDVLFHELGHHIHFTIRPEYNEKEDVADDWSGKLNANFVRKKYWYAVPLLTIASKVYKLIRREQSRQ